MLLALCRPLLTGDAFTEPASIRAIAAELVVSEAAVKQHLSRLYVKFDVGAHGERRRVQLANAAVARGAVKLGDLHRRLTAMRPSSSANGTSRSRWSGEAERAR